MGKKFIVKNFSEELQKEFRNETVELIWNSNNLAMQIAKSRCYK